MHTSIQEAVCQLRAGGLIITPTDTLPGISALPSPQSLKKLQDLKGRTENKRFILLTDSFSRVACWLDSMNHYDIERIQKSEKTTWLLPAHAAPRWLTKDHKIAVRVCHHPIILHLCKALGSALFSTSINHSGDAPLTRMQQLQQEPWCALPCLLLHTTNQSLYKPSKISHLNSAKTVRP